MAERKRHNTIGARTARRSGAATRAGQIWAMFKTDDEDEEDEPGVLGRVMRDHVLAPALDVLFSVDGKDRGLSREVHQHIDWPTANDTNGGR